MNFFKQKKQIFSIRKYTVGVCSVAVTTLFFGVSLPVLAEGETTLSEAVTSNSNGSSTATADEVTSDPTDNSNVTPANEAVATAKMELVASNVTITPNAVNVQVTATSGAKFKVDLDGYKFELQEMPKGDGTSLYTAFIGENTKHRRVPTVSPKVTLSYDFNGETGSASFTEANILDETLASVEKIDRVSKKANEPFTDEEIDQIKSTIEQGYKASGFPYQLETDKANGTVTVTVDFGTDKNFNLYKTATKQYNLKSFAIFNAGEVEVKPDNLTISNKDISGYWKVPKGKNASIIYGTKEHELTYRPAKQYYWKLGSEVNGLVVDPTVIFRLVDLTDKIADKVVDLSSGGTVVPLHVSLDKYFKSNYFPEVTKNYDFANLSQSDKAEIRQIVDAIVTSSSFENTFGKDILGVENNKVDNYHGHTHIDSKGVFVKSLKEVTLSDGTTVAYKYYINWADLLKKEPEKPEVPSTPEKPEVPSTPEKPEAPSTPEKPEVPSTPEKPEVPSTPEKPEVPSTPEKPEVPSTPEKPEVPSTPEKPEVPSTPEKPEVPSTLEKPEVPSTSKKSKVSVTSEKVTAKKQLPYTGSAESTVLTVAGVSALGLARALKRRKRN